MNPLKKVYYHLTAYVPRRLPASEAQFQSLKRILKEAYGVSDEPATWVTVSGQITSTPATKLRKSWGSIANTAKRLKINKLAKEHSGVAMQAFTKDLETAFHAECERQKLEAEASDKKAKEIEQTAHAEPQPQAGAQAQENQASAVS